MLGLNLCDVSDESRESVSFSITVSSEITSAGNELNRTFGVNRYDATLCRTLSGVERLDVNFFKTTYDCSSAF